MRGRESNISFIEAVVNYFLDHAGQWVSADTLSRVGGRHAWRTRVSEARRKFGMQIDNQIKRGKDSSGRAYTVSRYIYREAA